MLKFALRTSLARLVVTALAILLVTVSVTGPAAAQDEDVTAPDTPQIELLTQDPVAGQDVTLRFTSADAESGLESFWYGIDEEVKRHNIPAEPDGTATITFPTPAEGGRIWVYVWAYDNAGNASDRAVFSFFVTRIFPPAPVGAWRLDGDTVDDTGSGNDLTLPDGVMFGPDRNGEADRALSFDGTGCIEAESPLFSTTPNFSVAAWARVDDASEDQTVIAQAGQLQSMAGLGYDADSGNWRLTLTSGDRTDPTLTTLDSGSPAEIGGWTHLAVTIEPGSTMSLYVMLKI